MKSLAESVEGKWIELLVGDRDDLRERLVNHIDVIRREYLEGGCSPFENMVVGRVISAWLSQRYFDAALAVASEAKLTKQVRFFNQQATRAQQRFAGAIKSLLEVRQLLVVKESER